MQRNTTFSCRQFSFSTTTTAATTTSSSASAHKDEYDVTIVGGGVVGIVLARNLSRIVPSNTRILLLERGNDPTTQTATTTTNSDGGIPNARSYAISPFAWKHVLGNDLLLQNKQKICPYQQMQIWESTGPATLLFDTHDIPNNQPNDGTPIDYLGAMVEDSTLVSHLWNDCHTYNQTSNIITLHSNSNIQNITLNQHHHPNDEGVTLQYTTNSNNHDENQDVMVVKTKVLIAADGANSYVRNTLNMPIMSYGYGRKALTCTVKLDSHMPPIAFQRMEPNGPMALLPTYNPNYATIVWSTTPDICHKYQQQQQQQMLVQTLNQHLQTGPQIPRSNDAAAFVSQLTAGLTMKQWNDRQGFIVPPKINNIEGKVLSFDLKVQQATNYTLDQNNVFLMGDAAHTIHPMAGQGLNLGLNDVHSFITLYQQALESGMDISSTHRIQYQHQRQLAVSAMQLGIHTLHELYRVSPNSIVGNLNSLGMNLLNTATPLRSKLAQIATGIHDSIE